MTIIHGFTSFNTIRPRSENRAFINGDAGPTKGVRTNACVRADRASSLSRELSRCAAQFECSQRRGDHRRRDRLNEVCVIHNLKWLIRFLDSAEFTLSDPADAGESKGLRSQ